MVGTSASKNARDLVKHLCQPRDHLPIASDRGPRISEPEGRSVVGRAGGLGPRVALTPKRELRHQGTNVRGFVSKVYLSG